MSDSDLSSQKQKSLQKQKSRKSIPKQKSIVIQPVLQNTKQAIDDPTGLYDENKKLRRKLKQLSVRLDEQLEKAAQNKLKHSNQKNGHPVSLESQNLQLQNAYKMIQRLQKAVKDYESKQSYHVTLKRVLDLEGIIKKKQQENDEQKLQIKTLKKMIKQKQKYIEELIQNSKKMGNPTEDLEAIGKLKIKIKKLTEEIDTLRKKEMEKHGKLVMAERKIVEMEQDNHEEPIAREEELLKQMEEYKNKYKESMQRIQRQNIYISKLNEKLNSIPPEKERRSERKSERSSERSYVSRSLQDLPGIKKKMPTAELLGHLPSPKIGIKLRRY